MLYFSDVSWICRISCDSFTLNARCGYVIPWFRQLYLFYKILHSQSPRSCFKLIPKNNNLHVSRSALNN